MVLVTLIIAGADNLALAYLIVEFLAALFFAWIMQNGFRARKSIDANGAKALWKMYGPLFFGFSGSFGDKFDIRIDPRRVSSSDFAEQIVRYCPAIEVLNRITERYLKRSKTVT